MTWLYVFRVSAIWLWPRVTGQRFALGHDATVTWESTSGGPPATRYGYPGSWRGVWVNGQWFWPDFTQVHGPLQAGKVAIDLGGKPFWPGIWSHDLAVLPYCGFAPQTVALNGVIPEVDASTAEAGRPGRCELMV
jgi:hypothetical protein